MNENITRTITSAWPRSHAFASGSRSGDGSGGDGRASVVGLCSTCTPTSSSTGLTPKVGLILHVAALPRGTPIAPGVLDATRAVARRRWKRT